MELVQVVAGEYETPDGEAMLSVDNIGGIISGFYEDKNNNIYDFEVIEDEVVWEERPVIESERIEVREKIYDYIN